MTEYWVEEDIRPVSHEDSDRLLIENLEPIVDALKQEGIISWHFLREDDNWRGTEKVLHIRLRFKVNDLEQLKKIEGVLKRELDTLQQNRAIIDHYVGSHGNPVGRHEDYYQGENAVFDEHAENPKGWSFVERYLEIGSEMALLLIKGRLGRIQLGSEYGFYKISHCFPNQCRHYPARVTINGDPNWVAYNIAEPTDLT